MKEHQEITAKNHHIFLICLPWPLVRLQLPLLPIQHLLDQPVCNFYRKMTIFSPKKWIIISLTHLNFPAKLIGTVRSPLMNPLVAPSMHHPYYGSFPLHHFKSVFPSLFPPPSAFYSPTSTATSAFSSVSVAQTPVSEATASNNSSPSLEHLDKKDNSENEEDIEEDNVTEGRYYK